MEDVNLGLAVEFYLVPPAPIFVPALCRWREWPEHILKTGETCQPEQAVETCRSLG